MHPPILPRSQNRMAAQTRFALENVQRDLQQPLPQLLPHNAAILIPHQRWQQRAGVLALLPPTFGFFAD